MEGLIATRANDFSAGTNVQGYFFEDVRKLYVQVGEKLKLSASPNINILSEFNMCTDGSLL